MKATDKIPPRIIQVWVSRPEAKNNDLPLLAKASSQSVKCLNPDFEYLLFDGPGIDSFLDREFPEHRPVYEGFPLAIQRFDFFRYLAIYRYGGFYFDLDIFLATGLHELLTLSCVFPFEELTMNSFLRSRGIDWEVGNYAFGAAAGHPFLKAIIDNCVRAQKDPEWVAPLRNGLPLPLRNEFHVLNTTGPALVTRTLVENTDSSRTVTVLFPEDVCDSRNWNRFGNLGVHMLNSGWRNKSNFLWRRVAGLWAASRRRRYLMESRKLGNKRSFPFEAKTNSVPLKKFPSSELLGQTERVAP